MKRCIDDLHMCGFRVRGLVTDNHSSNVGAFKVLLKSYPGDLETNFQLPDAENKTYVFFDTVHLVKNIRNNLLNSKKFVFPGFKFEVSDTILESNEGYISWHDIHRIYDKDITLTANLRKAPKLSYNALHPGNNKQNVGLALAVFDEKTIAACMSYFPTRKDMAAFLKLISTWWIIANSNRRYNSYRLANAIEHGDGKIQFYKELAQWIEEWSKCPCFCLSKQTANAFILTLRSQAKLIEDLLSEGFSFVLTRRFQSDPLENRFSQYRSLSGGRFLVSLREVQSSERVLTCRSLLKAGVNYWKEEAANLHDDTTDIVDFLEKLEDHEGELFEVALEDDSIEVAELVAGYIARKLLKNACNDCYSHLISNKNISEANYLQIISRGGLITPSKSLASMVSCLFAQAEYINSFIDGTNVWKFSRSALEKYAPEEDISCAFHRERNRKKIISIVINCFYNNMQKRSADGVRKEGISEFKKRQRRKDE